MSVRDLPSQEELQAIASGDPLDPIKMIEAFKARIAAIPEPICEDGKPIHWVSLATKTGVLIQDSAKVGPPFKIDVQGMAALSDETRIQLTNLASRWLNEHIFGGGGWSVEHLEVGIG